MIKTDAYIRFLIILFLVCLLCYFNSLKVPFQFDGVSFIQENPLITNTTQKGGVLKLIEGYPPSAISTRPFLTYTFGFNYFLGQENTLGYHLFNLGIHFGVSLLIFLILLKTLALSKGVRQEFPQYQLPILASLIFASHPAQTQAITYLMSRSASLCALFYLASFYCFILALGKGSNKSGAPGKRLAYIIGMALGSLLLMRIGLGVKLIIVSLPLVMATWFYLTSSLKGSLKDFFLQNKTVLLLILTPFLAFFIYRSFFTSQGMFGLNDQGILLHGRAGYLMSQIKWSVFYYLKIWLFPVNLNIDPDAARVTSAFNLGFLSALGVIFALVCWVWKQSSLAVFGFVWMLFTFAPESSLIPLLDLIAEHRLYLPGVGFAILVSTFIVRQKHSPTLSVLIIICLFAATLDRNRDWFSEVRLWNNTTLKSPNKSRPYSNHARALTFAGQERDAAKNYEKAIRLNPNYFEPHHNLGNLYMGFGDCEAAIQSHTRALMIRPGLPDSYFSIGQCHKLLGNFDLAVGFLKKAVELNPRMAGAYRELGMVYYFNLSNQDQGKFYFRQAVRLDPNHASNPALINLING